MVWQARMPVCIFQSEAFMVSYKYVFWVFISKTLQYLCESVYAFFLTWPLLSNCVGYFFAIRAAGYKIVPQSVKVYVPW